MMQRVFSILYVLFINSTLLRVKFSPFKREFASCMEEARGLPEQTKKARQIFGPLCQI